METVEVTGVSSVRFTEERRKKLQRMAKRLLLSKNEVLGLLIDAAQYRSPKIVVDLAIDEPEQADGDKATA
jgi:hypothetical protein